MTPREYTELLEDEYLREYIPAGGGTIKFAVTPSSQSRAALRAGLEKVAQSNDLRWLCIDAADYRIHLIQEVFFAISRSVAWNTELERFMESTLLKDLIPPRAAWPLNLNILSSHNALTPTALRKEVAARIRELIHNDYSFCAEFRIALAQLCLGQLHDGSNRLSPLTDVLEEWLAGRLPAISRLKETRLFQQIRRNSARHLLYSLLYFLNRCGPKGTLLTLDLTRYFEVTSVRDRDSGRYYSSNATLDLYELLRQFIDDADELQGTMIVVLVPEGFLLSESRSIERYQALKMRIWSDVRVKGIDNPVAPLVRLSGLGAARAT